MARLRRNPQQMVDEHQSVIDGHLFHIRKREEEIDHLRTKFAHWFAMQELKRKDDGDIEAELAKIKADAKLLKTAQRIKAGAKR